MNLTVCYITGRKEPKIEWFRDSLDKQLDETNEDCDVIIIDRFCAQRHNQWNLGFHYPPKPNVWQGEYRLAKEDWWAMSNARNTALCQCVTHSIAYVDDLSVLMPGWLNAVKEACEGNYVACGAYRKVKNLVVENGEVKSYEPYSDDCRLSLAPDELGPCTGDWLYGCSCCFPTEALLSVGGWPEYCDGLGSEDYCLGICLGNAGFHLKYDKRMMTYESEELHNYTADPTGDDRIRISGGLKRMDKGVSPNDKSHAALRIARQSKYFPNYYEGGIRALRQFVLAGNPFPVIQEPQHDWFDNQPIREM